MLTAAFFFGFTSVIASSYYSVIRWFVKLFIYVYPYGTGSPEIIDLALYLHNLKYLHRTEPVFFMVFYAAILTWIVGLLSYRQKEVSGKKDFQILSGLIVSQLVGVLMVSKHFSPGKEYYLLPELVLSGLVFGLVLEQRKPAKLLVTAALVVFGIMRVYDTSNAYRTIETIRKEELSVSRQVEELSNYSKVYYYRSSSLFYALKFGDNFSFSRHATLLNQLYPRVYFYEVIGQGYSGWDDWTNLDRIRAESGGRIVFQGTPLPIQFRPSGLEDIFGGHIETAYRLLP